MWFMILYHTVLEILTNVVQFLAIQVQWFSFLPFGWCQVTLYKSQLGFGAPKSEVSLYTRSDLNNIMVPVWFGNIFYITAITLSKYTYYLTKQCLLSEMRIDLSIKIIGFYYITLHLLQRCSPNLTYTTCPAQWMTFMVIGKVCKFLFWMNYCFKPFNFLSEIFLCRFLGKKIKFCCYSQRQNEQQIHVMPL